MNESSTNIYRVPAKVISTGSGLSTVIHNACGQKRAVSF